MPAVRWKTNHLPKRQWATNAAAGIFGRAGGKAHVLRCRLPDRVLAVAARIPQRKT